MTCINIYILNVYNLIYVCVKHIQKINKVKIKCIYRTNLYIEYKQLFTFI